MSNRTEGTKRKLSRIPTGRLTPLRLFSTLLAISLFYHQEKHFPVGRRVQTPAYISYLLSCGTILENLIKSVEAEWEPEEGFFWKIRQGNFEKATAQRTLSKLAALPSLTNQLIPSRLVSVLWYVPIFMEWQLDRVRRNGADIVEYKAAIDKFTAKIERILGVP